MPPTALTHLDPGNNAVVTVAFAKNGAAQALSSVTFKLWPPGASASTDYVVGGSVEATNPATGTYVLTLPVPDAGPPGLWEGVCAGSGGGRGAVKFQFWVNALPGGLP